MAEWQEYHGSRTVEHLLSSTYSAINTASKSTNRTTSLICKPPSKVGLNPAVKSAARLSVKIHRNLKILRAKPGVSSGELMEAQQNLARCRKNFKNLSKQYLKDARRKQDKII